MFVVVYLVVKISLGIYSRAKRMEKSGLVRDDTEENSWRFFTHYPAITYKISIKHIYAVNLIIIKL